MTTGNAATSIQYARALLALCAMRPLVYLRAARVTAQMLSYAWLAGQPTAVARR